MFDEQIQWETIVNINLPESDDRIVCCSSTRTEGSSESARKFFFSLLSESDVESVDFNRMFSFVDSNKSKSETKTSNKSREKHQFSHRSMLRTLVLLLFPVVDFRFPLTWMEL